MKSKSLTFFIIFSLIATSIFGFLYMSGMTRSECPLFQMLGGSCSTDINALVSLSHHLAGLKILFLSFITVSFSSFLAVLLFCIVTLISLVFLPSRLYFNFRDDRYIKFNPLEDLISWLSLLNKGDHLLLLSA